MKRSIDSRVLLLCLAALTLAACGAQRSVPMSIQTPDRADTSGAAVSREFRGEYAEALRLMREQRYEQAGELLAAMTHSYPGAAGPYINLGLAYLHLGRGEEAETVLVAATDRHPRSVVAHNLLGVIYREEGRFEDAQRAYQRALALDADYADAHLNLGILLDLYLQRPDEALRHYERYREIRPADAARVEPWIADLVRNGGARRFQENGSRENGS